VSDGKPKAECKTYIRRQDPRAEHLVPAKLTEKPEGAREGRRLQNPDGVVLLVFQVQVHDRVVDEVGADCGSVENNWNLVRFQLGRGPDAREHEDL
jgi:hypothetical protein